MGSKVGMLILYPYLINSAASMLDMKGCCLWGLQTHLDSSRLQIKGRYGQLGVFSGAVSSQVCAEHILIYFAITHTHQYLLENVNKEPINYDERDREP